jgi:hypothetical protein
MSKEEINLRRLMVYIGGKYTGENTLEVTNNIQVVEKAAVKLWDLGFTAIAPHLNSAHFEDMCTDCDYTGFLEGYLLVLAECDAILLVDNWKESKGACIEKNFAEDLGIPVFTEINELHSYFTKGN